MGEGYEGEELPDLEPLHSHSEEGDENPESTPVFKHDFNDFDLTVSLPFRLH
jgi:hypothetical protein